MAVRRPGQDVELLAAIGTVTVPDEAEVLEDIEGPIDRGGRRGGVGGPAALHQLRPGEVAVDAGQDLDERPALGRPAHASGAQQLGHRVPGRCGKRCR